MRSLTIASVLFAFLGVAIPVLAEEQPPCSHDPVLVNGQKLYESCHCEGLEYPDIAAALKPATTASPPASAVRPLSSKTSRPCVSS